MDEPEQIEMVAVSLLKKSKTNARRHPPTQIKQIGDSFAEFGLTKPLLIDEQNRVLVGNGRLDAAIRNGIAELPCVRVTGWSDHKKRSFAIAENRLGELSHWDAAALQASVGESEVLQALFPDGVEGSELPKPSRSKQSSPAIEDSGRYLKVGRVEIPLTEDEEQLLEAVLRRYIADRSTTSGFFLWVLSGGK